MMRFKTITAAMVSAILVCWSVVPATSGAEKSSAKRKSTAGTPGQKKAATEDADSGSAAGGEKKPSGSSLDLPLPAKLPGPGGTNASAEKAVAPTEKAMASGKKKDAGNTTSGDKSPEKPATESAVKREHAPNATVEPESISEFAAQPSRIQQLMRDAIDLTRLNLTYTFGSADPDNGGMDCSGTIYYLLQAHGFKDVPRDSSGQYLWARRTGTFFPVVSKSADSVEFSDLLPGDLMFWTGTYDTSRDVPISHVMLYLGREKTDGKRIMVGASDGRSYNGIQRWGVSVFDFKMPKPDAANGEKTKVDFVGYARIPGLRGGASVAPETIAPVTAGGTPKPSPKPVASSKKKKKSAGKSE
jgi:cell wall-associated NlpC family hydrolase